MAGARVKKLLDQGISLHQAGRISEAEALYRKVLSLSPSDPDAQHMLGVAAIQRGDFERAIPFLHRARNSYPRMPELHNHLGMAQRGLGKLTEAQGSFRTALLINPRFVDAHVNLADVLTQQGLIGDALSQIQHALRIDSSHVESYNMQGNILHRQRRYAEAVASYQQGLARNPASGLIWQNMGNTLREMKDFAAAATAYQEAMRRQPKDARICLLLGATQEKLGQPEAAEAAYREALKRKPGWSEADFFLSALRSRTGDEQAPATAPQEFVTQLFDAYASNFDQHLIEKLKYRAPELLSDALTPHWPTEPGVVIDLGCGTGLLGPLIRPHASQLHGVDLSPNMIQAAAQRRVYDHLELGEMVACLASRPAQFDAVVATDVLIYVGDLAPLFAKAHAALRPGGLFAFTVEENTRDSGYWLQPSRRYAHAADYLRKLAAERGFVEQSLSTDVIRQQSGQAITGHIVVFRRNP